MEIKPTLYLQPDTYTLTAGEYNHLLKMEEVLQALMEHGVHQWSEFDKAMESINSGI